MKRKYWLMAGDGSGDYKLIDNDKSINDRVVKLKADKRDTSWTEKYRGKETCRITDDGNGLTWLTADGLEVRLNYSDAAELLLLLSHLSDHGNYFVKYVKEAI
jgi:isocitrate dehydrogenase